MYETIAGDLLAVFDTPVTVGEILDNVDSSTLFNYGTTALGLDLRRTMSKELMLDLIIDKGKKEAKMIRRLEEDEAEEKRVRERQERDREERQRKKKRRG